MDNIDKINQKKQEIKNYERILKNYQSGRWYDQGRRHLQSLKDELTLLETPKEQTKQKDPDVPSISKPIPSP